MKTMIWVLVVLLGPAVCAAAEGPEFVVTIQDHRFSPQELTVPAQQRIKLIVKNTDIAAAEFESYDLVREKVVKGGSQIVVYVGPLKPGTYHYFDDLHHATPQGVIRAQ
jgi:hypothetical protein